ncbi:DUF397 domain-containing protein [Streptomyces bauhiniae]|uniref:DUF397 domain-containing protein n=1 Tax=Streptomyces bauhiniae TaxID=2340725 RepID=UPI0036B20589
MSENLSTLKWFKSSYSGGNDGNSCVELAVTPSTLHVRDSKYTAGPQLALAYASWTAFLAGQVSEPAWFKSTYSSGTDGESCVEVAVKLRTIRAHAPWETSMRQAAGLNWFKSSHSGGTDGNSCVEVARAPHTIHVRDSKHTAGPQLALTQDTWTAFVTGVRD